MNQYSLQGNFYHTNIDNTIYQEKVIRIIRQRFGIVIHSHQIHELNKIIHDAFVKFSVSPDEYLLLLEKSAESTPVLDDLMTKITVGETYFFRDKKQVKLLEDVILPELITKKRALNDLNLRIWSAGCASGEEIYTIVMILNELLSADIDKWKLQLLATDINTHALKKAIKGHYHEWSMRSINDYYKKKYFTKEKNIYVLTPEIMNKVEFTYLNLNDNTYPSIFNGTNAQDLILCRNVLIYFDEEITKKIMQGFCASLVDNGYLMLGASDPIVIKNMDLTFVNNSLYIHKKLEQIISRTEDTYNKKLLPIKTNPIQYKPIKVYAETHKIDSKKATHEITQSMIMSLIHEGKWKEALKAINNYKKIKSDVFILNAKATVFANLGNLNDAVKLCEEIIKIDPINIQTHFILAMSLVELNEVKSAEDELRKVIFLDKNYVQAHFQLGLLLLRIKKHDMGIKSLQNALIISKSLNQTQPVTDFDALTYGKLSEILQREIELHKISKG